MNQQEDIIKAFGHRLRVRICGICLQGEKILLVKHRGLGETGEFWAPPGGGLDYGETTAEALIREFQEETGLEIAVKEFLFVHEFMRPPLHGIELFFRVEVQSGTLKTGTDPEMLQNEQIIQHVDFYDFAALAELPPLSLHNVLRIGQSPEKLLSMRGLFRYT